MSFVATAIIGVSTAIGVGGSIYSASKASKAQQEGTDKALDAQYRMYEQSRGDLAPWREGGEWSRGELQNRMAAGPGEFNPEEQPGYKFGFQEFIQKPYENQQGARGKRLSGETLKELSDRAMQYGETQYGNFLNRYYASQKPYQAMSQQGLQAATGQANIAQQTGVNVGNIEYQNAIDQGNTEQEMISGVSGAIQEGAQSWQDNRALKPTGTLVDPSTTPGWAGWEGPT